MPLLYDCWFVEGELDWENSHGNQYLENDKFKKTLTKHNVPLQEAQEWLRSGECFSMNIDAHRRNLDSSYYCTIAAIDGDKVPEWLNSVSKAKML